MPASPHYDLHSHTTLSDGTLSPQDLVCRARAQGVDVLAVTDHDVTDGLAEATVTAAEVGLHLVPGVEISVTWSGVTFHIVGLNIDPAHAGLQAGLARLRAFRTERGEEIARRLEKHGIEGALAGAQAFASGPILSRTHFARFLVAAGHAQDMRKVFRKFLIHNRPGYVSGHWATLEEAVGWIVAAGGQAVIAHPARYRVSATRLRQFIEAFRDCGGVGIEVVSGSHSAGDVAGMAQYAKRYGLLASCGSDYHGPEQSWQELGRPMVLPAGCVPVWNDWPAPDVQQP
ncbi:MAG TPA: PHP domain-containing protein [Gammaproteobacteria bacterium]|nr:PHP domain-containing protein [Gammaproteobacteria bacterium]